jgi:hypothetical protein
VAKAARVVFSGPSEQEHAYGLMVELAEKIGMTLVTFARSPNLYVHASEQDCLSICLTQNLKLMIAMRRLVDVNIRYKSLG